MASPFQALVDEFAATHCCASVAWGVVVDGELVHAHEPDTVYRIASMTKSFTCAAVLALRDEGVLTLDVPVRDYAPELSSVRGPDDSPPITLRHLMSMQAGLATDDPWADRHLDMSPAEIDEVYASAPAFAMPTGTGYEYSNLGFGIIGRVVQRATGTRVQDHITERFLRPLGLTSTTWVEPQHSKWARPFRVQDGVSIPDPHHPIGDGEIAPMGGLWTTVRDLAKWITFLNEAHRPTNGTAGASNVTAALHTSSRREMQQVHTHIGRSTLAGRHGTAGYGFGVRTFDDDDLGMNLSHSGGVPGYGSNMRWLHAGRWMNNVGAIALANTTYAPVAHLTMSMLASLALELPRRSVDTVLLAAQGARLVDLLNRWSDATATALFADNVALDDDFGRRANAAHQLVAQRGRLNLQSVRAEVLTRGTLTVAGADGCTFTIDLQLAPLAGSPVQWYAINQPA